MFWKIYENMTKKKMWNSIKSVYTYKEKAHSSRLDAIVQANEELLFHIGQAMETS